MKIEIKIESCNAYIGQIEDKIVTVQRFNIFCCNNNGIINENRKNKHHLQIVTKEEFDNFLLLLNQYKFGI